MSIIKKSAQHLAPQPAVTTSAVATGAGTGAGAGAAGAGSASSTATSVAGAAAEAAEGSQHCAEPMAATKKGRCEKMVKKGIVESGEKRDMNAVCHICFGIAQCNLL